MVLGGRGMTVLERMDKVPVPWAWELVLGVLVDVDDACACVGAGGWTAAESFSGVDMIGMVRKIGEAASVIELYAQQRG